MSGQKFYASPTDTFTWKNGAVGHRTGGAMDCLGPYAKVHNCPIDGTLLRRTCYATGYADTAFSIPACTRVRGRWIKGYFAFEDDIIIFRPMSNGFNNEWLHEDRISAEAAQVVEHGRR